MWVEGIAAFLGLSLLFYCLLGGADFGAGILEAFAGVGEGRRHREEQRELVTRAIGPVREANHVWLILALVILFVGFPAAFPRLSISFHLPLTLMLLGIVLRGCAFTFRHYDAVKDPGSQRVYSAIFALSSLVTPFFLGTVAGAMLLGKIHRRMTAPGDPATAESMLAQSSSYGELYVAPWLNAFSLSVGAFTCALFAFLAAVYLLGETRDPELRKLIAGRARAANGMAIVSGLLVFAAAKLEGLPLARLFLDTPLSLGCVGLATFLLLPLWAAIHQDRTWPPRFLAAAQVALVLIGWFGIQYPVLISSNGPFGPGSLSVHGAAAPEPALRALFHALTAGAALIFPALIYLLRLTVKK